MLSYHILMPRTDHEPEREGSEPPGGHPSPAVLERFMLGEPESATEHRAVVRHLMAGCEKCRGITARLWNRGGRGTISLIEMLAGPKTLARHRRRARSKKWDPRMSAAVTSLESVARDIIREYMQELEGLCERLETLAAGLARVPVEDLEKISVGEQLQAAVSCVLQDHLRPAIDGLLAAADLADEPEDEEAETA
jgi:hypothetical protein